MKHPPFCPNILCKLHAKQIKDVNWFQKNGVHYSKALGIIQRYRCKYCGRTFSRQTFSIDYYAKKIIDYNELIKKLVSTSSTRDIARDFNITTGTVQNKIFRMARQAIAIHEELKKPLNVTEDLVADGFESFCVSQYFPNNIHLLVLRDSQYVYFTNYVTIRRKGRMTYRQKSKRKRLESIFWPAYKGIELSFAELLDQIHTICTCSQKLVTTFYTDEKPEYKRAIKKHVLIRSMIGQKRFIHIQISSKKARTYKNELFPANYLERQIRKDLANHVRETVCFSRNVNNCMERLMIYLLYHNYMKVYREKYRTKQIITHAEVAGIYKDQINAVLNTAFTQRRFLSLENIKGFFHRLWHRQQFTPLKQKVEYVPKYALA